MPKKANIRYQDIIATPNHSHQTSQETFAKDREGNATVQPGVFPYHLNMLCYSGLFLRRWNARRGSLVYSR